MASEEEKDSKDEMDEKEYKKENHFHYHKGPKMVIGILILAGIFALGAAAGMHRNFGFRGERNIIENGRFGRGMMGRGFESRGAIGQRVTGKITVINGNSITINNSAGDTAVTIQTTTSISKAGVVAKQSDLTVGNTVSVVGQSDASGALVATFINIKS